MAVDPVASPRKVCIIDDDGEYGEFLSAFLRVQQMDVDLFRSGTAFLADAQVEAYDFFLVDLALPGVDGVDLIALIRARSNAGLVIISGRMGPDAFNAGLSAGADMFLNKPVRFDQVLQAIRTVSLRVARMVAAAARYPDIRNFSTTAEARVDLNGRLRDFHNTNALIRSDRWEIGVSKTGYISEAGRCLVMQARVADKPVVIVLLDSQGKLTRVGDANRVKRWMEATQASATRRTRDA